MNRGERANNPLVMVSEPAPKKALRWTSRLGTDRVIGLALILALLLFGALGHVFAAS